MSKRNEDSIERFFRKAVNNPDMRYQESDWLKMEKMLEEETAKRAALRAKRLRRITLSVAGLSILFSSVYFSIFYSNHSSEIPRELVDAQKQGIKSPESAHKRLKKENQEAGVMSATTTSSLAETIETRLSNSTVNKSSRLIKTENNPLLQKPKKEKSIKNLSHSGFQSIVGNQKNSAAKAEIADKERNNDVDAEQKNSLNNNQRNVADNERDNLSQNNSNNTEESNKPKFASQINKNISSSASGNKNKAEVSPRLDSALVSKDGMHILQKDANSSLLQNGDDSNGGIKKEALLVKYNQPGDETPHLTDEKSVIILLTKNGEDAAANAKETSDFKDDNEVAKTDTLILLTTEKVEDAPLSTALDSENKKIEKIPSRWSIALSLAPDFSTTKLTHIYEPGKYFGLIIGYQLVDRLTITSGILSAHKRYKGKGSEYQPPTGYWEHRTNGIVPAEIKGTCTVIEVPVVIQYNLIEGLKSRVYFSAGASSYIMQHEAYSYSFDEPNPGAANSWSNPKASTYWFGIGHLSAGYERQVSPRIAIGIEPFLKIPLSGIGWSKLDLYTTGAYINVRYRILKRNM